MIKRLLWWLSDRREAKVADSFAKSKLGGKGMLFRNNVGMMLFRNTKNKFDCLSEVASSLDNCASSIKQDAKIKFSGMQVVIETDEELSYNEIDALEGMGFQYLGAVVPFGEGEKWQSALFTQDPDYWSKDFEEFLLTFHDFCQKKHESRMKN